MGRSYQLWILELLVNNGRALESAATTAQHAVLSDDEKLRSNGYRLFKILAKEVHAINTPSEVKQLESDDANPFRMISRTRIGRAIAIKNK